MTSRDIGPGRGHRRPAAHHARHHDQSVDALRRAKSRGVRVTAEATRIISRSTDECLRNVRLETSR